MLLTSGKQKNKTNHCRRPVCKARDLLENHSASDMSAMKGELPGVLIRGRNSNTPTTENAQSCVPSHASR